MSKEWDVSLQNQMLKRLVCTLKLLVSNISTDNKEEMTLCPQTGKMNASLKVKKCKVDISYAGFCTIDIYN